MSKDNRVFAVDCTDCSKRLIMPGERKMIKYYCDKCKSKYQPKCISCNKSIDELKQKKADCGHWYHLECFNYIINNVAFKTCRCDAELIKSEETKLADKEFREFCLDYLKRFKNDEEFRLSKQEKYGKYLAPKGTNRTGEPEEGGKETSLPEISLSKQEKYGKRNPSINPIKEKRINEMRWR